MLTFQNEFFKDEIRNNFLISEMMKRAWAAHLKILEELKVLFIKYDLLYYADFGTLLGAVRHGGIIPWDDDIDISMPRADYMKLLEHADEIGGDLVIRSVYNTDSFINFHAVATNKTDILRWDDGRFKDYYGCPFICYIDIFPMDYIPRDPDKKKLMQQLYSYAYQMVHTCTEIEESFCRGSLVTYRELKGGLNKYVMDAQDTVASEKISAYISQLHDLEGFLNRFYKNDIAIDEDKSLRNQLCLVTEYIAASCKEEDADRVDYCPHMAYLKNDLSRDKNWVKETAYMPFENTKIAVPKMYHEVLVSRFGNNYMTPLHLPSTHEYPYYRTQVEVLIEGDTGENYHEYAYKKELLNALETFDEGHHLLDDLMGRIIINEKSCNYKNSDTESCNSEADADTYENIKNLLADLQDGAVGIGETIDNICGEGTDCVRELEKYCEKVYRIYQSIEKIESDNTTSNTDAENDADVDTDINTDTVVNNSSADLIVTKESAINDLSYILSETKRLVNRQIHEDIPDDWNLKLNKKDGSVKKIIIYGISAIDVLVNGHKSINKLRNSLNIFENSKEDVCVIFEVPGKFMDFLDRCGLELAPLYKDVLETAEKLDNCIVDKGIKPELAVSIADAYYGDECPLMNICKDKGMPIMIQKYDLI